MLRFWCLWLIPVRFIHLQATCLLSTNNPSKSKLLARIDFCMGGRAAEEIMLGKDKVRSQTSRHELCAIESWHCWHTFCLELHLTNFSSLSKVTAGAHEDLLQAAQTARQCVMDCAMSDVIGFRAIVSRNNRVEVPHEVNHEINSILDVSID